MTPHRQVRPIHRRCPSGGLPLFAVVGLAVIVLAVAIGLRMPGPWFEWFRPNAEREAIRQFVPDGRLVEQLDFDVPAHWLAWWRGPQKVWVRHYASEPYWVFGCHGDLQEKRQVEIVLGAERWNVYGGEKYLSVRLRDLTGDGVPEVVINDPEQCLERVGYARIVVFQLHPQPRVMLDDEFASPAGGIVQADNDPPMELAMPDPTAREEIGPVWGPLDLWCPLPIVMLKFDGDVWRPAADLCRKPIEKLQHLSWPAPDSSDPLGQLDGAPRDPLALGNEGSVGDWGFCSALELIYAGHADEAWRAFDTLWPSHPQWAPMVRHLLITSLKKSPYWPMLVELNGAALDD